METRCLFLLFAFVRCARTANFNYTSATGLCPALAERQVNRAFQLVLDVIELVVFHRHAPPFGSPSAPRSARGQGRLPAARGFV